MAKPAASTATAASATPAVPFRPVRGVRLYETIVEQIAALVRDGHLASGDRFPPERELQQRWRVSRPVLREAFRALEMQGLVESRPGGGRYLRAERIPSPAEIKGPPLATDRQSLLHILEAREAVEVKAAALAAANASRGQLAAIGRPLRMLDTMTPDAYRRGDFNFEFHSAIARASGNPLLEQVAIDLIGRFHEAGFEDLPDPDDWRSLKADHQPVYDAIAAGDERAAAGAMAAHFQAARRRL
jgi:GntR family transcriptional regulator, transcriptional repressor for pyruvate dehydrogenase complex